MTVSLLFETHDALKDKNRKLTGFTHLYKFPANFAAAELGVIYRHSVIINDNKTVEELSDDDVFKIGQTGRKLSDRMRDWDAKILHPNKDDCDTAAISELLRQNYKVTVVTEPLEWGVDKDLLIQREKEAQEAHYATGRRLLSKKE